MHAPCTRAHTRHVACVHTPHTWMPPAPPVCVHTPCTHMDAHICTQQAMLHACTHTAYVHIPQTRMQTPHMCLHTPHVCTSPCTCTPPVHTLTPQTYMQPSHVHAHAMHTPCTRHTHAVQMPCTCHAQAKNTPCTCHAPCADHAHTMHTPWTCRAHGMHTRAPTPAPLGTPHLPAGGFHRGRIQPWAGPRRSLPRYSQPGPQAARPQGPAPAHGPVGSGTRSPRVCTHGVPGWDPPSLCCGGCWGLLLHLSSFLGALWVRVRLPGAAQPPALAGGSAPPWTPTACLAPLHGAAVVCRRAA